MLLYNGVDCIAKRITSSEMTFYNLDILLINGIRSATLDGQAFDNPTFTF